MRLTIRPAALTGGTALVAGVLVFGVSVGVAMGRGRGSGESTAIEVQKIEAPAPPAPADLSPGDGSASPERGRGSGPGGGTRVLPGAAMAGSDLPPDVLRLAVARAPFEEDREAPPSRYRMPGDEEPRAPREPVLPEAPEFRLLGSAAIGIDGWAIIEVDDDDIRLVRAGQNVEGFQLAAVQPDMIVLSRPGQTVQIALVEPSPTVRRAQAQGRGGQGQEEQGGRGRGTAQGGQAARGGGAGGRATGQAAAGRAAAAGIGQILQALPPEAQGLVRMLGGQGGTIEIGGARIAIPQLPAGRGGG